MKQQRLFTLAELLVITIIICISASILLGALSSGVSRAKLLQCAGNLRETGQAIIFYSSDNCGQIPNVMNNLETSSIPLLRLPDGSVLALGRLINSYTATAAIFGCPDSPGYDEDAVAAAWETAPMVWSAYLYRAQCSGFQAQLAAPENIRRALVTDFACVTAQGEQFAPHSYQLSNLLFPDTHVESRRNSPEPYKLFTVRAAKHGSFTPDCTTVWLHADE